MSRAVVRDIASRYKSLANQCFLLQFIAVNCEGVLGDVI